MRNKKLFEKIDAIVTEKSMLKHPFYKYWLMGKLTKSDLREYMKQYYHLEGAFPRFMSGIHSHTADAAIRQTMLMNLRGEEEGTNNHLGQLVTFSESLGLTEKGLKLSKANAGTKKAVDALLNLTSSTDINKGLAALTAYKHQIAEVASTKEDGLKKLYGITSKKSLQFFTTHSRTDRSWHEMLDGHVSPSDEKVVLASVRTACDALLSFLDGVTTKKMLRAC